MLRSPSAFQVEKKRSRITSVTSIIKNNRCALKSKRDHVELHTHPSNAATGSLAALAIFFYSSFLIRTIALDMILSFEVLISPPALPISSLRSR